LAAAEFVDAGADGARVQARALGHARRAAPAEGEGFGGRPQAPLPLREQRAEQLILPTDLFGGAHPARCKRGANIWQIDSARALRSQGSAIRLKPTIDPKVLHALITRAGGEVIPPLDR